MGGDGGFADISYQYWRGFRVGLQSIHLVKKCNTWTKSIKKRLKRPQSDFFWGVGGVVAKNI